MRRVPTLAILACLVPLALSACGEAAPKPATAPPTDTMNPTANVAGETGFPGASSLPSALGSLVIASSTPYPGGYQGALLFLQSYENDLIGGRYAAAWTKLAPAYQATIGTYDVFEADRTAFTAISGKTYNLTANPTDVGSLADLLKGKPFAASIDQKHAVVLSVQWPTLVRQGGSPAEVWVVNPASGAGWELYRVR